jgi:hypothetical protein
MRAGPRGELRGSGEASAMRGALASITKEKGNERDTRGSEGAVHE